MLSSKQVAQAEDAWAATGRVDAALNISEDELQWLPTNDPLYGQCPVCGFIQHLDFDLDEEMCCECNTNLLNY